MHKQDFSELRMKLAIRGDRLDVGEAGSVVNELYSCDPRFMLQSARESLRWVRAR